jgi:anaerobic selenocysteine-containing dehydrogenase
MSLKTACPLDCYDACSVIVEENALRGDKAHPYTHGYLCPHLNHYAKHARITTPRYKGEAISMDEALQLLKEKIGECDASRILHYRGSGNLGLMQRATDHFYASYGSTLTEGSLCDGAGQAGILEGRGKNYVVGPEQIEKAEVVILWGRNPHTTNAHLLPHLKGKKVIVIDPVRTKAAEEAAFYLQIKPHGDLYLALLLTRFIIIEGLQDIAFLDAYAKEYEEFYELTQTVRIKAALDAIDVSLGDIGTILELIRGRKTVILAGVGIQKYRNGADVMRAIDGLGAVLGLFGKEGCGVSFLGDSVGGIEDPFNHQARRVAKADAAFSDFDLVFIQGANPLNQMPDTNRVKASLEQVPTVVYFGLHENETSAAADLVIPAKSFLEKEDIRSSYGHNAILRMPGAVETETGISEYALAKALCDTFSIAMKEEAVYLEHFASFGEEKNKMMRIKGRPEVPYAEGFDTDDGQFCFLEEADFDFDLENDLFLLTPKSAHSLNSQFNRESKVFLHPDAGYDEGARLRVSSPEGSLELEAAHDKRLRKDCVLIYSGTPGVNSLTSAKLSYEGKNAAYQENKVKVEAC